MTDAGIVPGDPRLAQLYAYWRGLCGDGRLPSRADIDPIDFRYALGIVSLIDVEHAPLRYRFRLVSTQLTEHLGYEMTGKYAEDLHEPQVRAFIESEYGKVLKSRAPVHEQGSAVLDGRLWRHETLLLPCSNNGYRVDMLISARVTERPRRSG